MPEVAVRDEAHWHELRRRHVGASEVAALFGVQPAYALSHYALWQVKAGRMEPPPVESERAEWGLRLEEAIARAAAEKEGWRVRRAGYWTHPRVRGMGCSPDHLVLGDGGEPSALLEVKNVDWLQYKRAWGDEPPPHVLLQLQHQLACVGAARGYVAALVGGNELRVWPYEARPRIIKQIERRVAEFWRSVEAGREPPIDGTVSTAEALRALYPEATADEPLDLSRDNEAPELCATYLWALAERRQVEEVERRARNGLIAKLGDHAVAYCNGYLIRAADVPPTPDREITPEMVGQVIRGRRGYRKLTVKEADDAQEVARQAAG